MYHAMLICLLYILDLAAAVDSNCPRDQSKVVRKVVEQELTLFYNIFAAEMPRSCPLHEQRDVYGHQEAHKYMETPTKWGCGFCGKAFYEERWLNLHFENRHPDSLRQGDDVTCLADHCDVFRCDVLTGRITATYWDSALCKDSDLHDARSKCNVLVNQCTPQNLIGEEKLAFQERMKNSVCGFLTCKSYWDLPDSKVNPVSTAVYVMAAIFLSLGVFIYYYIAYSHFFTDESIIKQWKEMDAQYEQQTRFPGAYASREDVRHRTTVHR